MGCLAPPGRAFRIYRVCRDLACVSGVAVSSVMGFRLSLSHKAGRGLGLIGFSGISRFIAFSRAWALFPRAVYVCSFLHLFVHARVHVCMHWCMYVCIYEWM